MPETLSPVAAASRLGVATRRRDPKQISEARRDLAAAQIAAYVTRTVAAAPPLTDGQVYRIAALLRPTMGGASK